MDSEKLTRDMALKSLLAHAADVVSLRKKCVGCAGPVVAMCSECGAVGFCASSACTELARAIHVDDRRCTYLRAEAALHARALHARALPRLSSAAADAAALTACDDPCQTLMLLESMRRAPAKLAGWFPAVWSALRFGGAPMAVACDLILQCPQFDRPTGAALEAAAEELVHAVIASGVTSNGAVHTTHNLMTAACCSILVMAELDRRPASLHRIVQPIALMLTHNLREADASRSPMSCAATEARAVAVARLMVAGYAATPPRGEDLSFTTTSVMETFEAIMGSRRYGLANRHEMAALFVDSVVRRAADAAPQSVIACLPHLLCGLRSTGGDTARMEALASCIDPFLVAECVTQMLNVVLDERASCCRAEAMRMLSLLAPRMHPADVADVLSTRRLSVEAVTAVGSGLLASASTSQDLVDAFGVWVATAPVDVPIVARVVARVSRDALHIIAQNALRAGGSPPPPALAAALEARAPVPVAAGGGVAALRDAYLKCCALCGSRGAELKTCARCHVVRYCGVEHQRADWKKHRVFCARL